MGHGNILRLSLWFGRMIQKDDFKSKKLKVRLIG